ncbi:kinesin-related protein 3-like [Mercenaria mercenaria]|uniref:kinesin-related protein 3-like n=1 Tax=Mercenaria mercenaria TaxID=6596 RepID=UPI00234E7D5E|nr:kinesin-related protein 3-like [Mercenaria mercenaria]XP_053406269.1 kinesin-related protein 3-like [Mercenaria mercenaria]XP_053406270.1 kinesin-related protein 3-like [Mercenaria mercenaria]
MGTLYECLKEAKLERYYPSFRAQGITKSEALTRLTASDYPVFGITSAEDKRRLVELISIIKAVHNVTDRDDILSGPSVNNRAIQNARNKSPRKRNRSPAQTPIQTAGRALSATNDVRVRDRSRTNASSHHLSAAGAALLDLIDDEESSEDSDEDSEEHSDYEPAVKHSVTASVAREFPGRVRKTPVEKVKYGAGYNYGVPGGGSGARTKLRPGAGRLHEDKIKVCVRKRPLSKREVRSGEEDMIQAASTTTLVVSEPKQAVDLTAYTLQHEFIFDEVFEESCSNEDVYIRAARPLINCIFDGGSATCFAYGQTGAGKTHTMIGNREIPGLYLLAAHDIFSIIESAQYGTGVKVWVSFFEIYCGQLFDLLNKRNRLHAREDGSHRVCIAGLTETEAVDEQSLMQVLEYGNSVRSKGASGVNPDSSRSHAVLQMEIRDRADKRLGRISFIDLAGSERASDSGDTDRQTRMEGAEINQSLLALKECIRSIDQESRHKPFRQSKLTHILKDSFIGNSKTCMIANISPGSSSCEHTLNTLRYADRVKELRRGAQSAPSTSRSTNVAMSNILMNIPASAPSIFQPSNILCSSTPMRQSTRQFTNRNASADLHLDPSETPIRGPGARRKTSSALSRSESKSQNSSHRAGTSFSSSTSSKSQVTRHVAPNVINSGNKQNLSSNSESDQTESDSCNMTGPQKPVNLPNQMLNIQNQSGNNKSTYSRKNMYVSKSSNLGGQTAVSNTSQNIPVIKSSDTDNDFPTTDFNNEEEELNDLNRTGDKNNVAASVPVFPSTNSGKSETQSGDKLDKEKTAFSSGAQSRLSSVSASVPVLRKKNYVENQTGSQVDSRCQTELPQSEQRQNEGSSRPQANSGNSQPYRNNSQLNEGSQPSSAKSASTSVSKTKDLDVETKTTDNRLRLRMPSTLTESFNEDLLFDSPSIDQRVWTPRTPSENSGTQPRIPQDPSLQPEIPAVLPAKSTELTTFSQSPRWHLNKNQSNYPVPAQQPQGFRPEPLRTFPKEKSENRPTDVGNHTNVQNNSAVYTDNRQRQLDPDNTKRTPYVIPKSGENHFSNVNTHTKPGSDSDMSKKTAWAPNSVKQEEKEEHEPISANWFTTPADHETHLTKSVSEKKLFENTDRKSIVPKRDREDSKSGMNLQDVDDEYLPMARNVDKNRSAHSDSGILSAVSDTECKQSQITTSKTSKNTGNAAGYQNSNFAKPGYFSDSGADANGFISKHRLVHSPVTSRQSSNTSPVIKDYVSLSPVNEQATNFSKKSEREVNSVSPASGMSSNGVLKTEKLKVGATFSPIHPQPVTNSKVSKSVAVSKDILHPTPLGKISASVDTQQDRRISSQASNNSSGSEVIDLKSQLITSHEDQLATVTSLCKQEMKLLLGAKAGNKKFDDYMKKVSDVLSQKMAAIQLLQDQIIAYQLSTDDAGF